jgi:hypothetical protein
MTPKLLIVDFFMMFEYELRQGEYVLRQWDKGDSSHSVLDIVGSILFPLYSEYKRQGVGDGSYSLTTPASSIGPLIGNLSCSKDGCPRRSYVQPDRHHLYLTVHYHHATPFLLLSLLPTRSFKSGINSE